jgi:hypothetical protein
MNIFPSFVCIAIDKEIIEIARYHAFRRTEHIVRQFIPLDAPLSALESNYIGAVGEAGVRYYLSGQKALDDNYESNQVDSGDLRLNGHYFDIKTEAIPFRFFKRLYTGMIEAFSPYGCRVWTARHHRHLDKYDGGIIFAAVPVPDDSKNNRAEGVLREEIVATAVHLLIPGYVTPGMVEKHKPTWYSPPHPITGKQFKYHSPNFIFHHSELKPVREIKIPQ